MRPLPLVLASTLLLVPRSVKATEPDTGLALFTAAAFDAAGFIVGGALMARSPAGGIGDGQRNLGWLAIQAGFTLSPVAAHGVVGEWSRGVAFGAIPAGALAGTAAYYRASPNAIERGSIADDWLAFGLFTTGLAVSTAAAIDVLFAGSRQGERGLTVQPAIGSGHAGFLIKGML